MTERMNDVELLPPDDGASPWLPMIPVVVPVFADGDYARKVGTASVYAGEDRSLRADITFDDDFSADAPPSAVDDAGFPTDELNLRFSVSGQILTEKYINDVRVAQTIRILSVGVARS